MENIELFLKEITAMLPPGKQQYHNIILNGDGLLELTFMLGNVYIPVIIEPSDYDKPMIQLAREVVELVKGKVNA